MSNPKLFMPLAVLVISAVALRHPIFFIDLESLKSLSVSDFYFAIKSLPLGILPDKLLNFGRDFCLAFGVDLCLEDFLKFLKNYISDGNGWDNINSLMESLVEESLTKANEALLHYSNIKVVAARLRSPG